MDQELLDKLVAVTTAEGTLAHRMGINRYHRRDGSPGVHVEAYLPDQGPGTRTRNQRDRSSA